MPPCVEEETKPQQLVAVPKATISPGSPAWAPRGPGACLNVLVRHFARSGVAGDCPPATERLGAALFVDLGLGGCYSRPPFPSGDHRFLGTARGRPRGSRPSLDVLVRNVPCPRARRDHPPAAGKTSVFSGRLKILAFAFFWCRSGRCGCRWDVTVVVVVVVKCHPSARRWGIWFLSRRFLRHFNARRRRSRLQTVQERILILRGGKGVRFEPGIVVHIPEFPRTTPARLRHPAIWETSSRIRRVSLDESLAASFAVTSRSSSRRMSTLESSFFGASVLAHGWQRVRLLQPVLIFYGVINVVSFLVCEKETVPLRGSSNCRLDGVVAHKY